MVEETSPTEDKVMYDHLLEKGLIDYPHEQDKGTLYNFFKTILGTKDSVKVGNLTEEEINRVRRLRNISHYADFEGLKHVGIFFHKESEIILGSSLSREGFFVEASITSKKEVTSKAKLEKKKKNLFGGGRK